MISRRRFLACSGATAGAVALNPRLAFAGPGGSGHTVVLVVLAGGLDSLTAVPPVGDPAYYRNRPALAVPAGAAVALDGYFGLHPALASLAWLWQEGAMAVMPAVGGVGRSRSHFTELELLARGVPAGHADRNGWLARHLATRPGGTPGALHGISAGHALSMALHGDRGATSVHDLANFGLALWPDPGVVESALRQTYGDAPTATREAASSALAAASAVRAAQPHRLAPANGAAYDFGDQWTAGFRDVAQLIRADVGLEAATIETGSWDTHIGIESWRDGHLDSLLRRLGTVLGAFLVDISDQLHRVTVVVVSEFGRRVAENGSGGTDHGAGGLALVIGRGIRGGVHGGWPGLDNGGLANGDVAPTLDVRDVLAEVVSSRLGNPNLAAVFPDHAPRPVGFG